MASSASICPTVGASLKPYGCTTSFRIAYVSINWKAACERERERHTHAEKQRLKEKESEREGGERERGEGERKINRGATE